MASIRRTSGASRTCVKHAFLRAGFGFGNMPRFVVEDDITRNALRPIRSGPPAATNLVMTMHAVHRKEAPPGPAGRWLLQSLKRGASAGSPGRIGGTGHKRA